MQDEEDALDSDGRAIEVLAIHLLRAIVCHLWFDAIPSDSCFCVGGSSIESDGRWKSKESTTKVSCAGEIRQHAIVMRKDPDVAEIRQFGGLHGH